MDFVDDLPADSETERFRKHNRFLRTLKEDTLLIVDNFNATASQDEFLPVVLKYRCRILFTTRSSMPEHRCMELGEITDNEALFQLAASFYTDAGKNRPVIEQIIQTVHRHTLAVELAARLLETGFLEPQQVLEKLRDGTRFSGRLRRPRPGLYTDPPFPFRRPARHNRSKDPL